jgi:hypothetical protein
MVSECSGKEAHAAGGKLARGDRRLAARIFLQFFTPPRALHFSSERKQGFNDWFSKPSLWVKNLTALLESKYLGFHRP